MFPNGLPSNDSGRVYGSSLTLSDSSPKSYSYFFSGALVTHDVPADHTAVGNPAPAHPHRGMSRTD